MQPVSSSNVTGNSGPQPPPPVNRVTTTATAMSSTGAVAQVSQSYNAPPAQLASAVFILREIVALLFVLGWLAMLAYDIFFANDSTIPFWLHMLGAGVLAYALGVNVENLTAFKGIQVTSVAR